jgi:SAM-dependent methyltransferase
VSLADDYRRQLRWRPWTAILDALPSVAGQTVLDLGCAVGDQAALLADRGANVIGIDANEELLAAAKARGIPNAEFRRGDLRSVECEVLADGIWCSFAAAYLVDLPLVLAGWRGLLRPGGWIAITEADDLFAHRPLSTQTTSLLEGYVAHAFEQGWYDFRMGRRLGGILREAGFEVLREFSLPDAELAFDGPALPEVVEAWRARFARMKALQEFCGPDFEWLRDEFLDCLLREDHRAAATVRCCVAVRRQQLVLS